MNALQIAEIEEMELLAEVENATESSFRFTVENLEQVNWAFRKIKAYMEKKAELEVLAKAEIERIQSWLAGEVKQIDNSIGFFEGLLTEYAVKQRELDPKFKCSTPYGKVSFRKQQPKWEYEDEVVLDSLKASELNEYIRVKEEINKADLKKAMKVVEGRAVTSDGEIIEGIKVIDQPDKLDIKVAE